jgi:hypothetical protein
MRAVTACTLLLLGWVSGAPARAEPIRLGLEFFVGAAANLGTPLEIRQQGQPRLRVDASWRSDAFEPPIVWAVRLSRGAPAACWALELVHHKLYLDNPPADVRSFSISHGLNLVTLQRAWSRPWCDVRLGAGAAIAHPENEVRGLRFDERRGMLGQGYYLAGPALTAGAGRPLRLGRCWALVVELRGSVAPVSVPIEAGSARLTNVAFHLLIGAGGFTR